MIEESSKLALRSPTSSTEQMELEMRWDLEVLKKRQLLGEGILMGMGRSGGSSLPAKVRGVKTRRKQQFRHKEEMMCHSPCADIILKSSSWFWVLCRRADSLRHLQIDLQCHPTRISPVDAVTCHHCFASIYPCLALGLGLGLLQLS